MNFHEFASLFPMISDADLAILAKSIKETGQHHPIITLNGEILDGRNRYNACIIAGVDPVFEEFRGEDPLRFAIDVNMDCRRHLTESQRGMVAAKLATMKSSPGTNQYRSPSIDGDQKPTVKDREQAAKDLNVGISTLDRARKIHRLGSPELVAAVESGEVTVGAAYKVAELPHEEQSALVTKGKAAIQEAAKAMREMNTSKTEPEEPDPVVVDGSEKKPLNKRSLKIIHDDGLAIVATAKSVMARIDPADIHRVEALQSMIDYCQSRISTKK